MPNNFLVCEPLLKAWSGFVLPRRRPPDNMQMGWDCPQEDEFALCNMGVPSPYWSIAFPNEPPQSQDYFELDRLGPVQRRRWKQALQTFLKRLTWKRRGRIVLKSPAHTFRLPIASGDVSRRAIHPRGPQSVRGLPVDRAAVEIALRSQQLPGADLCGPRRVASWPPSAACTSDWRQPAG